MMHDEPTTIHPVQRSGGIDLKEPPRPPDGAGLVWGVILGAVLLIVGGAVGNLAWKLWEIWR